MLLMVFLANASFDAACRSWKHSFCQGFIGVLLVWVAHRLGDAVLRIWSDGNLRLALWSLYGARYSRLAKTLRIRLSS